MTKSLGLSGMRKEEPGPSVACSPWPALAMRLPKKILHDPYEGFNRSMFAVHEAIRQVRSQTGCAGVRQRSAFAGEGWCRQLLRQRRRTVVGVNSALQGKFGDAGVDLGRLLINSTVGIFGLFDVASELGLERHDEDFGKPWRCWGRRQWWLPVLACDRLAHGARHLRLGC